MEDILAPVKMQKQKPVRIMDILKNHIPSATIMADKILLKTIKINIGDCLIYIPKVIKLFFKPLLAPIAKPYWQQKQNKVRDLTKSSSISFKYLTFYIDSVGITTIDINKVKKAVRYI